MMSRHTLALLVTRARERVCGSDEAGFTLIEVIVSALILAIISGSATAAIAAAMHYSGNARIRSEAQALASADQAQLRGLNVDQLSNLSQSSSKTVNNTQFTVQESSSYVSDASGTPSCSNPSADYLKVTSTVTWSNMGANPPVTATSLLTPTIGSVDPTHGTLAVLVNNAAGNGLAGVNVTVSGPASLSGQTSSNGCVLFGDLPAGSNYTVSVAPATGTDVDAKSGQAVNATTPDVKTGVQVSAGSTAASSTNFVFDVPGTANVTFATIPAAGIPATTPAASPATVFASTSLASPSYRLCSAADANQTCPAVGNGSTSFPLSAWQPDSATPRYPYSYVVYAGVCLSDDPSHFSAIDPSVTVTSGNTSAVKLMLPAMIVRLYSGQTTSSSEIAVPAGATLTVKDMGCGMRYVGYTGSGPAPVLSAGTSVLPLNTAYGSPDTGLLTDPGMPYGNYKVCYTDPTGKVYASASFPNQGSGEVVNLFAGSAVTGASCP